MKKQKFLLHFTLLKHKPMPGFCAVVEVKPGEDSQGVKEAQMMKFEEMYGTPVRCDKVEEIETK